MDKWVIKKPDRPFFDNDTFIPTPSTSGTSSGAKPPYRHPNTSNQTQISNPNKFLETRDKEEDENSDELDDPTPIKKAKTSVRAANKVSKPRINKFLEAWTKVPEFSGWLLKSSKQKGAHDMAYCKVCDCEITAHRSEITRHGKSERHTNLTKEI